MVLFWGLGIFAFGFFIHLAWWRVAIPKKEPQAVLGIFLGTLVIMLSAFGPRDPLVVLYIVFLHLSLTVFYLFVYPGFQVESPSALILQALENAGTKGLAREEFERVVTDALFVDNRVVGLELDGLIVRDAARFKITKSGKSFLRVFMFYRRMMGLERRGG